MPKHDHKAIQQSFVSTSDESAATRSKTSVWLSSADNIERLLEAISGGQSVRRFCEAECISYSPVQRALTSPDLEPRYRQAQEDVAEHLLGEIERISQKLEDDPEFDPKKAAVILDGLKWRITKLNQRRYSDRQVVEQHIVDHAKLQREAVLQLARRPSPALIDGASGRLLPPQTPEQAFERTRERYGNAMRELADASPIPKERNEP